MAFVAVFAALTLCSAGHATELQERFGYGMNYAWKNYAGDFGGIKQWNKQGVSQTPDTYLAEFQDMADHGVKVVRWWVWPEFWTDAIRFSEDGTPERIAQQAIDDGLTALQLADQAGIQLMLCLFSFDGFRPSREQYGITMTGYHDMVIDQSRRAALMTNVVTPFVRALGNSPYADSLHSWDVINEPEWAVHGISNTDDSEILPDTELQTVTHRQMKHFIADTIEVLREETPKTPITITSAAIQWVRYWSELDTDFYQTTISNWANDNMPYTLTPADFGIDGKPVVIGGYPVEGLSNADHTTLLNSWYNNGYAGALGWDYRLTHSPGVSNRMISVKRAEYMSEYENFARSAMNGMEAISTAVDNRVLR